MHYLCAVPVCKPSPSVSANVTAWIMVIGSCKYESKWVMHSVQGVVLRLLPWALAPLPGSRTALGLGQPALLPVTEVPVPLQVGVQPAMMMSVLALQVYRVWHSSASVLTHFARFAIVNACGLQP